MPRVFRGGGEKFIEAAFSGGKNEVQLERAHNEVFTRRTLGEIMHS